MLSTVMDQLSSLTWGVELATLAGIGFGVLLVTLGLSNATGKTAPMRRMDVDGNTRAHGTDFDLILGEDNDPMGFLKAFVPTSKRDRTKVEKRLRQAGIQRRNSVRYYYAIRALLGLVLPSLFLTWIMLPASWKNALPFADPLNGITMVTALQVITALMVLGFYGPAAWLGARISARRQAIKYSLPNALDLLQISVEAGLGFDAAIVRVSHELAPVAPEISQEFMMLELEIQAGKERQTAFLDMAERTGLPEVMSFANVILQAGHFGTSVSQALNTFALDMRLDRELRAQEKANRLPVQMSGVMALFMMPVLLMICLTPMLIRWITMFG
ncbi:type II secretion system F family protein [Puniceibacterium confluentis]|uniref:type II secretion system F family protein n=1 Tax=Puniceibacterium confluentis TaxID=1958944 RepID=UPI0011B812E8|nr:type II secretion system F family protein [Puniceibacterium confluentis]